MIPKYYPWNVQFVGGVPRCEVEVIHPTTGVKTRYLAIVDTGADDLQLDQAAAASAGLNFASLPGVTVTTASGRTMLKQAIVQIELCGMQLTVPTLFGSGPAGPLLGRSALLAALEVGFDAGNWGYKTLVSSATAGSSGGSSAGPPDDDVTSSQQAAPTGGSIVERGSWLGVGSVRLRRRAT